MKQYLVTLSLTYTQFLSLFGYNNTMVSSMKKNSQTSSHLDSLSGNLFEENKWADWLTQNGRYLGYGLLALILVLIIGYRFSASRTANSENDYINAENDFQLFQRAIADRENGTSEQALKNLNAQLQRHPELQAKYQGAIAQALITAGLAAEAQVYANPTLARTNEENSPFYSDYAQTTLLIGNQQYAPALERSLALKQKMEENRQNTASVKEQASDLLYFFNLVRVGMLQQQLGLTAQEKETWQEWEHLSRVMSNSPNLTNIMAQLNLLSVGNLTFLDYIAERVRVLSLMKN